MPGRELPQGQARTYHTFPVGDVSIAGGTWSVDWERAHADAQLVLDAIDFSKRDIVIWVPGTASRGVHPKFEDAIRDSYKGTGSALVALNHAASWDLRTSVPTGVATLRIVLEAIRARGGNHRVLLAGESQGAWIVGEAMADPALDGLVDRAILLGHPWMAKHRYDGGQDPRVRVINQLGDPSITPVKGDPTVALDALIAVRTIKLSGAGDVLEALATNPGYAVKLLGTIGFSIPLLRTFLRDPHDYGGEMTRAVEYLRHGALPVSDAYRQLARLAPSPLLADPSHDEEAHRRLLARAATAAYVAQRAA